MSIESHEEFEQKLAEQQEARLQEEEDNRLKSEVVSYFHNAVNGKETGKPKAIGRLTADGRAYLENL